jgi:hypothetical protein
MDFEVDRIAYTVADFVCIALYLVFIWNGNGCIAIGYCFVFSTATQQYQQNEQ